MNINYAYWKVLAWRMIRGAVASALTQTLALHVDWMNPKQAAMTLGVSFLSGFFMGLGLAIRDYMSQGDQNSAWNKLPL